MKIAVCGKGGTGKTTVAAFLARYWAGNGQSVLAVDVDPDANLGAAIGFSPEELEGAIPVSRLRELVADHSSDIDLAWLYSPKLAIGDIPARVAPCHGGVRLLLLGPVVEAGRGCVCPEHTLVRRLVSNLALGPDDVAIMDMEAGLEHFARGTADAVDRIVVVVEPGSRSIQTYRDAKRLAAQLGIGRVEVVANKVTCEDDERFVREQVEEGDLVAVLPFDSAVMEADRRGVSPCDAPTIISAALESMLA